MQLAEKLRILSGAARYDVSCAASGAIRRDSSGKARQMPGVCHSWSADGRCISLLKVLLTNHCVYDCRYCLNRRSNETPRAAFTPEELASLASEFYRRNYVEGLFLSSGVVKSPDHTLELMLRAVRLLRGQWRFRGYIHLKLIPGVSGGLVDEAVRLADRISVNTEFASPQSLALMAPDKDWAQILSPMDRAARRIEEFSRRRKEQSLMPSGFTATGQSTQLIVGATPDDDRQVLTLASELYRGRGLKRVYYSAYVPVNTDAPQAAPPLLREHRLYQADWLLRQYGFTTDEILSSGMLDLELDPKCAWALRHPDCFPVDAASAPYEELLRIPGIGLRSAARIVQARQHKTLAAGDLELLGVTLKRARFFVTVAGKALAPEIHDTSALRRFLLPKRLRTGCQLTFLEPQNHFEEQITALTGEL